MGTFVRSYSEMKGRNSAIKPALVEAQVVEAARPKLAAHASPSQQEEMVRTLAERKSEPVHALVRPVLQTSTFVMPIVSGSGGAGKSDTDRGPDTKGPVQTADAGPGLPEKGGGTGEEKVRFFVFGPE